MKLIRILPFIFIVLTLFGIFYINRNFRINFKQGQILSKKHLNTVSINNQTIYVNLAITNEEKSKGLSGRNNLSENEGMLFIFDYKSIPDFWMKGMKFPLDIIWINDNIIVDVDENIQNPKSLSNLNQLQKYSPSVPINFVLEVNAGFCSKKGIKIG